eukprot:4851857-Pyramimonas_sp.AAC.1
MIQRPPGSPTRTDVPSRQRGLRDALRSPIGQGHRGRVGRARLSDHSLREPARASAGAAMHQPAPSSHRNRHRI